MTLSYTKNLHLAVPDFLTEPWHAEFAQAMDSIDEIIFHALVAQDVDQWHNSTSYVIGNLVISPETGGIFSCAVAHVSAPAPTTFTQDMTNNPTFWTPIGLRLASQAEAEAGVENTKYMSPLRTSQAIAIKTGTNLFVTGDIKPTLAVVAPAGWIIWRDGTIGDASSLATIRASADTQALYNLFFNFYADGDCPLSGPTGTPYLRSNFAGGTAQAFGSHVKVALPKIEGRVIGSCGAGAGLTPRNIGSSTGLEVITPTVAGMASHRHLFTTPFSGDVDPITNWPSGFFPSNWEAAGGANPGFLSNTHMSNEGLSQPSNNMQPSSFVNFMVKL